jgi:benzoyl-CoA reductase subunit D
MSVTAGIDVGTSAVKTAVVRTNGDAPQVLALVLERIRKRDMRSVVRGTYERTLQKAGLAEAEVDYVASTGAGELVDFRRGHFYGMTSHARGASHLMPETRTVLDVGALHARAIRIDERARVLAYKMTGQCASGSGQFVENIARYLGVPLGEVGGLSGKATAPEQPSGICAVLSETDVINMVSRGVATENILKGIHLSMAQRLYRLLVAIKAESPVLITGGLALNGGLVEALRETSVANGNPLDIRTHPDSVMAGALGAALWAGWRLRRLADHPAEAMESTPGI